MSYDMIDRFLRNNLGDDDYAEYSAALDALCTPQPKEPEQEPVAIVCNKGPKFQHTARLTDQGKSLPDGEKLYTTPPQRKPLTDEKVSLIAHNIDLGDWNDLNFKKCWHEGFKAGFREAEIEHNIKE